MTTHLPTSTLSLSTHLSKIAAQFTFPKTNRRPRFSIGSLRCAVSVVSEPILSDITNNGKPSPAEVSRTILELSSVGTLSTPTQDGWPLGIGVRFAVDPHGTPLLFLNHSTSNFALNSKSSFLVQVTFYSFLLFFLFHMSLSQPLIFFFYEPKNLNLTSVRAIWVADSTVYHTGDATKTTRYHSFEGEIRII